MSKKLPKTVYVRWDGENNDVYLRADGKAEALIDKIGDTESVGVYELKEVVTVRADVAIQRAKSR